jgi:hypothetical protein
MRVRFHGLLGGAIALILAFMPTVGSTGSLPAGVPAAPAWQTGNNTYQSPQFGYLVEWNDDWAARERAETSDEGGLDVMILSNNDGLIQVAGQDDGTSAASFLADVLEQTIGNADTVEYIGSTEGDIPSVEFIFDLHHIKLEAQTIDNAVVVVSLLAREDDYESALSAAQDGVTLNGTPLLTGEAAGPTQQVPEESTDEPTEEATDKPTEETTDKPTEETTDEPDAAGIDGDAYTSPDHEFSVRWDDQWEASASTGSNEFNELRLTSDTGAMYIISGSFYDGDAETCLEGEAAYFGTEDPGIRDWEPAVDAEGEPITGSGENVAYGVFTLAYGSDDESFTDLVDYIECRALIPGETTMAILASTTPELYDEHIEAVLEITNNIEMPDGSDPVEPADPALPDFSGQDATPDAATPEVDPTEEVNPTEEPTGQSGLDGNTFVSESFGFSVEVPADWSVEDATIEGGDEVLVVSNGLSIITIHATNTYDGDLPGCINFARDLVETESGYADLRLDATSSGEPFQGADDRGAYALFTFTGDDGEQWAHYVRCEHIAEGESVLILSHDVPYEDYASERQARRQIQNAIEFP